MMNVTPMLLAQSPELAILKALESVLGLAGCALIAAHPELESQDFVCEIPEPSVQACLADAISVHIGALECSLRSYGLYVASADNRHHCLRSATKVDPEF
jgi:hypothetical protein